jgi:carbonic anhydrase
LSTRLAQFAVALAVLFGAAIRSHSALAQRETPVPWNYSDPSGPDYWGDLEPDFKGCAVGQQQSPIDIRDAQEQPDLAPIRFDYKLSPLKIINNGYTVQVNYEAGSSITVNGVSLALKQFHFHHPSETAIDGQHFDLELHLVHLDSAANRTAVVSVLIKSGAENPLLRVLLGNVPQSVGEEVTRKKVVINAASFLPGDQNYYMYDGSLTTPPCTEPVRWYVMKTLIEASPSQIAAFAKLYPNNARPEQPLDGRTIAASNFQK